MIRASSTSSASSRSSYSSSLSSPRRRAERGDPVLDPLLLRQQGGDFRIVRGGLRHGRRAGREEEPVRERAVGSLGRRLQRSLAVPVVVEQGVLGQHLVLALVPAPDFPGRVAERLEQRHPFILVDVRVFEREGIDEEAAEVGVIALARGAGRGHHDAPVPRHRGDEAAARARGVHDGHGLGREGAQPQRQRFPREVGARQVEARFLAAAAPVAEEEDEGGVGRPGPGGHREHLTLHGLQRRPAGRARRDRRVLREPHDGFPGHGESLAEGPDQPLGLLPEELTVLGGAAEPAHDEDLRAGRRSRPLRVGRRRDTREREARTESDDEHRGAEARPPHARSFRRRYAHSPPSSPASRRKRTGMSHSDRSSYTVSPLSV